MSLQSLEYYASNIADPFSGEERDQTEMDEEGYVIWKQQSILQTIGTEECERNISMFLAEVLNELTKDGKVQYLQDCFHNLVKVYGLRMLTDTVSDIKYANTYGYKIIELLKFLESSDCTDWVSKVIPYCDLEVLKKKDLFIQFMNINYRGFMDELVKQKASIPDLLFEHFYYASRDNATDVLFRISQRDRIGINSNQITRGAEDDND